MNKSQVTWLDGIVENQLASVETDKRRSTMCYLSSHSISLSVYDTGNNCCSTNCCMVMSSQSIWRHLSVGWSNPFMSVKYKCAQESCFSNSLSESNKDTRLSRLTSNFGWQRKQDINDKIHAFLFHWNIFAQTQYCNYNIIYNWKWYSYIFVFQINCGWQIWSLSHTETHTLTHT